MSQKRILVVDDERHMQRLIQFALVRTGCRITTAGGGRAALADLEREPADLLVIDLAMDDLDGFETVREIRKRPALAHLPVIVLTARGESVARDEAAELGISAFHTKPFSPIELVAEAKRLLGL